MNSSALSRGESLTISNATIERVAEALMKHGRVKRGYLGVKTQAVRLPDSVGDGLAQETGLLIVDVAADSPAATSGLIVGDILVTFAGQPLQKTDDLVTALSSVDVEQKTPAQIVRGGALEDINIKVGAKG